MDAWSGIDLVRAWLVLILAVGQAVMAYWPDLRHWPETIASRSAALRNPVVPIDWAFAIWGLIFASSITFAVWQLLPTQLGDPLLRQVGWLACALYAGNIAWELYVPKRALDGVSVAIIVVELAIALTLLFIVSAARLQGAASWLVAAPFQLFAGWVSAATFVNSASALQRSGFEVGTGTSAVMVLAAGALGAAVTLVTGAWLYALAVAWALFGLVIANTRREPNAAIATLSGVMVAAVGAALALH